MLLELERPSEWHAWRAGRGKCGDHLNTGPFMPKSTAVPVPSRAHVSAARHPGRPAFAPVERLEDRQLLSAATFAAAAVSGRVTGFTLINPSTDKAVTALRNGSVIDLASLPGGRLNVRADTSPSTVGSVKLFLDGALRSTETTKPYALFGDQGNNFAAGALSPGRHTIRAVPFSGISGRGAAGQSQTISVTVVDNRPAPLPSVTGFSIIDPETGDVVSALSNGGEIDLADFAEGNFSIRANTSPARTGSVRFGLDGDSNVQTENVAPYALFGNEAGTYVGGTLAPGEHTLTATPFTGGNATGPRGTTRTVQFTVVDTSTPAGGLELYYDGANGTRDGAIDEATEVAGDELNFGDVQQGDGVLLRFKNTGATPIVLDGDFVIGPDDEIEGNDGDDFPSLTVLPLAFDQAFNAGTLNLNAPEEPDNDPNTPDDFKEQGNASLVVRTVLLKRATGELDFAVTFHEGSGSPGSRPFKTLAGGESIDVEVSPQTPGGANGSTAPSQGGRRRRVRGRTRL
jgi:hypothetical protein